jgi:hypothetical protein
MPTVALSGEGCGAEGVCIKSPAACKSIQSARGTPLKLEQRLVYLKHLGLKSPLRDSKGLHTRQIEFMKQMIPQAAYAASTGTSNVAQPSLSGGVVTAHFRIVKRTIDGLPTYTA